MTNFLLRERPELGKNRAGNIDIELVDNVVNGWYEEFGVELTPGKELLGAVKRYAQEELKDDPNKIVFHSGGLVCEEFQKLIGNL
ncbi:hypothetical protein MBH78_01475 [Oceanimonas sp. NS1]|nr:hypothetical protein [Oceanimonas sp. NS1]